MHIPLTHLKVITEITLQCLRRTMLCKLFHTLAGQLSILPEAIILRMRSAYNVTESCDPTFSRKVFRMMIARPSALESELIRN